MERFTDDYRIQRKASSTMSGCIGGAFYDRLTGDNPNGCPQYGPLDAERLLDRNLGEGSVVRVTVEVLHEEPIGDECINPWGMHRKHERRQ